MNKVTTKETIDAVAELAGVSKHTAKDVIGSLFQFVTATAKSGNAVSIAHFGTFKPVHRKERIVNTPMMSGAKTVPAKTALAFKVSKSVQL